MDRRIYILGAVIGAVFWLAGCGNPSDSGSGSSGQAGSGSGSGADNLAEVRLGYFPNLTHAQAVLEVASGDLQSALGNTKLTAKTFNAGPDLIQALNAGAIDVGYVGPGPAISDFINSQGQALRVISGAAANGVVIVARKDSGIASMKDLAGKHVATPQQGNTQDVSARHYMTAVLGQANADNVKPVTNNEQATMMTLDEIDAAWVPEPWGARLISQTGAVLIGQEKDLWPDHSFALTVVVTSPEFLKAHPKIVGELLDVHRQWTKRLTEHPESYVDQLDQALFELTQKKMDAKLLAEAMSRTEFTDDPMPATFATMAQWSYELRFVNRKPDLTGLFVTPVASMNHGKMSDGSGLAEDRPATTEPATAP